MFDFYVDEDVDEDVDDEDGDHVSFKKHRMEGWITLSHVCRRWRSVVFQSPCRLNLRLVCTSTTCARDILDIWPPLPLIIHDSYFFKGDLSRVENIIAALELNDRVRQIDLVGLTNLEFGHVLDSAAMQKPFPELTHLDLGTDDGPGVPGQILPDSFLGGTAPRLRSLTFLGIPFPGLPKLLLTAAHLVDLSLYNIPRSGYIPPEVMATSLSALTNLQSFFLHFRCPRPRPALESRRLLPPPLTRSILPSLTKIVFDGASEYLEEILARIDAPRLNVLHITFFNQIIFDTPQLFQFISRRPTLRAPEEGHIAFDHRAIFAKFRSQTSDYGVLTVRILCRASEWQLSSLEQVCTSSLPPLFTLEDLYIYEDRKYPPRWQDDVENTLWLELLYPFAAVKDLYLSEEFVLRIAPALQELVGGRTAEVLPTLQNIFLEGFQPSRLLHEGVEKFLAARRITSHPVAVSRWDRDGDLQFDW
ncbi:hypothetical protein F5888DRAFT_1109139 [Russula emetica]|nr:hypothetical protein F5888DRAFT_1109139 [Russula emetica]